MALADEFFFIVHDGQTGKLRLHARAAGLGLAGALVGELVLSGNVDVASGTLNLVDSGPPEDDLAYRILRQLRAERQDRSLHTWLAFLAQGAVERVGVRLTRAGQVEPTKSRRLLGGTSVRYLPTDLNEAVWPADRLNQLVRRGDPLSFSDAMLAGLVAVTGLTRHVWWEGDTVTLRHVSAALASLPMSLREVLAHTEAAVGDTTLSPHK
ncbi:MAG: GOLPH3/VPS74 family protein [Jiangellaceae bacterium]